MNLYKQYRKAYKKLLRCKAKIADITQQIQEKQEKEHVIKHKHVSEEGVFTFSVEEVASVPKARVEKLREKLTQQEFNACFGITYYTKAAVLRDNKLRKKIKPTTRKRLAVTVKTEE